MKTHRSFPTAPARLTIALPALVQRLARLWSVSGCAALALIAQPVKAAVTEAWVRHYNEYEANIAKVVCDATGDIIVTGVIFVGPSDSDMLTIKYSGVDGSVLWRRRYNGPNTSGNSWDYPTGLAVDRRGNVVVTGPSFNAVNSYDYDYYTAKYAAADGALLWEKRYNHGTVTGASGDMPSALALDASDNVVVTGKSANANGYFDYYTAKYAATNGSLVWERRYNGSANTSDEAMAVAVDGSGNVMVTGRSVGNGTRFDYYTAKYAAADGTLLWEERYNGPAASPDDEAYAVAADIDGNAVITGLSRGSSGKYDCYTARYAAASGALLWEKRYNGPADGWDSATAAAVDLAGNVVVTGGSDNGTNSDCYTAKYAAANGALLWERRYNGLANSVDVGRAVAMAKNGDVVVMATSRNSSGNDDYYTARYAAGDGALLWEHRHDGPGVPDRTPSLALGPNGMVAVAGTYFDGSKAGLATVVCGESLSPVSIAIVPEGVRLRFTGAPGHSYAIERAPAVTGPWANLATPTAPPDGAVEHVDTHPPAGPAFYRTSAP
jgi:hypothetical protein